MLPFMILFARGRGRHLEGITASTSGALTMNMAEQGKGTLTVKGNEMERRKNRWRNGSRERNSSREHYLSRSASPSRRLPKGVEPLSESNCFQKSDEFRLWLREAK